MSELDLHRLLCWGVLGSCLLVTPLLCFVVAPYGRHRRAGWGPTMPAGRGWVLMELPAVVAFPVIYLMGERPWETLPLVLACLWQLHYLNRGIVHPLRVRGRDRRVPWLIVFLSLLFNSINAYINARWLSELGDYADLSLLNPAVLVGLGLFGAGWFVNLHADGILFRLRKGRDGGYRVPHGGLYRWVSCPNYLGEIVEWAGWALAAGSLAGLAFAVFTLANLLPRALAHHRWYQQNFPDYPPERKALLPGWL